MSELAELRDNAIEALGRALFAVLTPITGARSTGEVLVTAGAADVTVPKNAYLMPVVGGQLRDDLLFKTTAAVSILAGQTDAVAITSNVGGSRHNLLDGSVLRFDPPLDGVLPAATASGAITGGDDVGALLKSLVVFEDVEDGEAAADGFAAKVGDSPAAVLAWIESEPVDGTSAGLRTSSTRASRGKKFYRESFVLYVRAGHLGSDHLRRREGSVLIQAITRLLSDRMQNDDGEQLSSVGAGVEITSRAKLGRGPTHYLYGLRLRMNQTIERFDARTYQQWTSTRMVGQLGPEDDELDVVDDTQDMP
jgi:hypothetical protein